jgi:hypothetical protein
MSSSDSSGGSEGTLNPYVYLIKDGTTKRMMLQQAKDLVPVKYFNIMVISPEHTLLCKEEPEANDTLNMKFCELGGDAARYWNLHGPVILVGNDSETGNYADLEALPDLEKLLVADLAARDAFRASFSGDSVFVI